MGLFIGQSIANACSSSQGAVADNARSLGITYINLAVQYQQLTGNGVYKGYASTYWQNQLSWRAVFNAATNKAECYKATLDLQHWTAQMNVNVNSLQAYINEIVAAQQAAATAAATAAQQAADAAAAAAAQKAAAEAAALAAAQQAAAEAAAAQQAAAEAEAAAQQASTQQSNTNNTTSNNETTVNSDLKFNRIVLVEK